MQYFISLLCVIFLFISNAEALGTPSQKLIGDIWYDDTIYLHTMITESNININGEYSGLYVVISYYEEKYYVWLLKEGLDSNPTIIKDIKIVNSADDIIVNIGSCIYNNAFNDNIVAAYHERDVENLNSDSWIRKFTVAYMPNIDTEKFEEIDKSSLSCQHQLLDSIS